MGKPRTAWGDLWSWSCALGLGLGQVKGARAEPRVGRLLEAPVRSLSASRAALSCSFGPFPPHPSPVTSPALLASFPLGPQRLSPVGPPPALLDDLESGRF